METVPISVRTPGTPPHPRRFTLSVHPRYEPLAKCVEPLLGRGFGDRAKVVSPKVGGDGRG